MCGLGSVGPRQVKKEQQNGRAIISRGAPRGGLSGFCRRPGQT